MSLYDTKKEFAPRREDVIKALDILERKGRVNCIQLATIAAGARRWIDEQRSHDHLENLLPDADEISLAYFKENGHWSMWATKPQQSDGENDAKASHVFARQDGATPIECILNHLQGKEHE